MSERMWAALLRAAALLLPAERRPWTQALLAELDEVPDRSRPAWLAGGLWLAVRESGLARRAGSPALFALAAAGTAWAAWAGPPRSAATVINRVDVIVIALLLAVLPWAIRRRRGPAADGPLARLVRAGGYALILAVAGVKAAAERLANSIPGNMSAIQAWTGEAIFLAVIAGYAVVILAVTARRSGVTRATLALGAGSGAAIGVVAWALGPLGAPLRVAGPGAVPLYEAVLAAGVLGALAGPVAAGMAATRLAAHRAGGPVPAGSRAVQGALAGLCTGCTAALVVSALSTATIVALPHEPGLLSWAAAHTGRWPPLPGRPASLHDFAVRFSDWAAGYLAVLVAFPPLGCGLGAWAGLAADRPGPRGRPGRGGGAGDPGLSPSGPEPGCHPGGGFALHR